MNIYTSPVKRGAMFENVFNAVKDSITVIDTELRIKFQNKAISKLYGSRIEEQCFKAYYNRNTPCEDCMVIEVLKDGKERRAIRDVQLPNDDILLLELSSAPIKDEEDKIIGAVEITRDVTKQKKAEALLNKTLLERNEVLKHINNELSDVAGYVKTVLPQPLISEPLRTDWRFIPSTSFGGDSFGYHWIDEEDFAMYLLDISGHGWVAALLSVSVLNVLRSHDLPGTDFRDPQQVLYELNNRFPGERHNDMFFTIWYGVYNKSSHQLAYASAGHPPALLFSDSFSEHLKIDQLGTPNFIIGGRPDITYQKKIQLISRHSRLYIFSNGVYDITKVDGSIWGFNEFLKFMTQPYVESKSNLDRLLNYAQDLSQKEAFADDFTILEIVFE